MQIVPTLFCAYRFCGARAKLPVVADRGNGHKIASVPKIEGGILLAGNYVLSCCSTADLNCERLLERGIPTLCFHYTLDGEEHRDDWNSESLRAFYQAMREGKSSSTSMVSVGEYLEFFAAFLEEGKDVLHVCLSGGLSGTCGAAKQAAELLRQQYPAGRVLVVDSLAASAGYGLLVDTMALMRANGMGMDALYVWAEEHKRRLQHWFFSTDLSAYIRGGRISATAGAFGSLLGICPLLHMNGEGKLVAGEKIRSKRRVITEIVERMALYAENGTDYAGRCFLSHSDCLEDAKAVAALVERRFPRLDGSVEIFDIGTTIGSHTGPGTVALFFFGKERE